ncbi:MAG TPA: hypothetical protein PLM98_05065 [Thiolinea sp.]|nr:hypothetical protein [Thiolinea sp.]
MKLTKTSLAVAALFFCLGSSVFAANSNAVPMAMTADLPKDQTTPDVLDATGAVDAATEEDADSTNQAMDLAELQAEIRIACEEFATDEKVTDEKTPEFVDACVAENMPAEGEQGDDAIESVDNGVPAIDETAPADAAQQPIITGQAATQE